MTEGSVARRLLAYTLPLILGNIFQLTYNLVDSVVVGRFAGDSALAAVGVCDPVMNLLILGVSGVCVGASVLMSRFYGAGDREQLKKELETTVSIGLIFALFVALTGWLLTPAILKLLKTPGEILKESAAYMRIIFIGMPFTCIYNIYAAGLRSLGDTRTPLRFLIFASVTNILLDLLFVAVFAFGVTGAAAATVIAQSLSAALCILRVYRKVPLLRFQPRELRIDGALAKKTAAFGGLSALQQCSQPIGKVFIQRAVNDFGTVSTIAAFNAVGKIEDIGLVPGRSVSDAIMTFTAQNKGAGKNERAEKGFCVGFLLELGCGALVCLIIGLFAAPLMGLFTESGTDIVAEGVSYFLIMRFAYVLPCLMNGNQGYFKGSGRMKTVLFGTLTQITVRVIVTYLLVDRIGITGVGVACIAGWSVQGAWQYPCHLIPSRKALKKSAPEP